MQLLKYPDQDTVAGYRVTFSTRQGQNTLADLLSRLKTFVPVTTTLEDATLKNFGSWLVVVLGGGEPDQANVQNFMMKLMKQPLVEQKESDPFDGL